MANPAFTLALLLLNLADLHAVASISIDVSNPWQQTLDLMKTSVDFECSVNNTSLEKCQFKVWDDTSKRDSDLIDSAALSNYWVYDDTHTYQLKRSVYTNLTLGTCRVDMQSVLNGRYVVGCRIRAAKGGWAYRYSTLYVSEKNEYSPLIISPSVPTYADPDIDLRVKCSGGRCDFDPLAPGVSNIQTVGDNACGATFKVLTNHTGAVWCHDRILDRGTIILDYAPPTSRPTLTLTSTNNTYEVGDVLEATCSVMESRPPADVTWLLDDVEVDPDDIEEDAQDAWRWGWQAEARTQTLRRKLKEEDAKAKNLICRVSHGGLKGEKLQASAEVHIESLETATETAPESTTKPTAEITSDQGNGVNDVQTTYIGASVGVSLLLAAVFLIVAHRKQACCFAGKDRRSSTDPTVAFTSATSQLPNTSDQSQPDLVVYAQVQPRDQRKKKANQSEPATSSSNQSQAEDVVYAQVVPRDQRSQAERVNPDHVVYAEIVSSEPARKTAKMAPQEPEVLYTEVAFSKK